MNYMEELDAIIENNDPSTEKIRFGGSERFINGTRYSCSNLRYELMEQIEKLDDDIGWITYLLIKKYFNLMLPLLIIPAKEILDGDTKRLDLIRDFIDKLEHHPDKEVWEKKKTQVLSIAEHIGIKEESVFTDITKYSNCIVRSMETNLYCIRKGKNGQGETYLSPYVYTFDTERVFVNTLTESEKDRCLIVAKIRDSEKERKIAYDDTKKVPSICIVVKDGENIFLSYPKEYGRQYRSNDKFHYGKRCTYMPVSILQENGKETGNTLPDNREEKWELVKLLDEEQMIFFPFHIIYLLNELNYHALTIG